MLREYGIRPEPVRRNIEQSRGYRREWFEEALVIEANRWLRETMNAGEIIAFCRKANAEVHALDAEALKLVSLYQGGVLDGWSS